MTEDADRRETALRWRSPILVPSEIVQGRHIVNDAIIARHIADGVVTGTHIASETVTAANIANRTRETWLDLDGAAVSAGTPVRTVQGANNVYSATAFDAAGTESVITSALVPADWASGLLTFKLYWTNLGAGAGNVVWQLILQAVSDTEDLNANGSVVSAQNTIAAPAQNILKVSTHTRTITPTAGELITVYIARLGGDAADTLANDAGLVAVEVEYTSDM